MPLLEADVVLLHAAVDRFLDAMEEEQQRLHHHCGHINLSSGNVVEEASSSAAADHGSRIGAPTNHHPLKKIQPAPPPAPLSILLSKPAASEDESVPMTLNQPAHVINEESVEVACDNPGDMPPHATLQLPTRSPHGRLLDEQHQLVVTERNHTEGSNGVMTFSTSVQDDGTAVVDHFNNNNNTHKHTTTNTAAVDSSFWKALVREYSTHVELLVERLRREVRYHPLNSVTVDQLLLYPGHVAAGGATATTPPAAAPSSLSSSPSISAPFVMPLPSPTPGNDCPTYDFTAPSPAACDVRSGTTSELMASSSPRPEVQGKPPLAATTAAKSRTVSQAPPPPTTAPEVEEDDIDPLGGNLYLPLVSQSSSLEECGAENPPHGANSSLTSSRATVAPPLDEEEGGAPFADKATPPPAGELHKNLSRALPSTTAAARTSEEITSPHLWQPTQTGCFSPGPGANLASPPPPRATSADNSNTASLSTAAVTAAAAAALTVSFLSFSSMNSDTPPPPGDVSVGSSVERGTTTTTGTTGSSLIPDNQRVFISNSNSVSGTTADDGSYSYSRSAAAAAAGGGGGGAGGGRSNAHFQGFNDSNNLMPTAVAIVNNVSSHSTTSSGSGGRGAAAGVATIPAATRSFFFADSTASMPEAAAALFSAIAKRTVDAAGVHILNQYVIMDTLGRGTCGQVKLAFSLERNISVAIKITQRARRRVPVDGSCSGGGATTSPSPDPFHRSYGLREEAFRREIAIMKKLRHKNIVQLYEVIDDPHSSKLYLVMQYVDKGSIVKMRSDGTCDPLPSLGEFLWVGRQVAAGLAYLHRHQIAHRDIKPENILVCSDGRVFLSDFGISNMVDRQPIAQPSLIGDEPYQSPSTPSAPHGRHRARQRHQQASASSPPPREQPWEAAAAGHSQTIGSGTPLYMAPELHRRSRLGTVPVVDSTPTPGAAGSAKSLSFLRGNEGDGAANSSFSPPSQSKTFLDAAVLHHLLSVTAENNNSSTSATGSLPTFSSVHGLSTSEDAVGAALPSLLQFGASTSALLGGTTTDGFSSTSVSSASGIVPAAQASAVSTEDTVNDPLSSTKMWNSSCSSSGSSSCSSAGGDSGGGSGNEREQEFEKKQRHSRHSKRRNVVKASTPSPRRSDGAKDVECTSSSRCEGIDASSTPLTNLTTPVGPSPPPAAGGEDPAKVGDKSSTSASPLSVVPAATVRNTTASDAIAHEVTLDLAPDIWAFGVSLFALLFGELPFHSVTAICEATDDFIRDTVLSPRRKCVRAVLATLLADRHVGDDGNVIISPLQNAKLRIIDRLLLLLKKMLSVDPSSRPTAVAVQREMKDMHRMYVSAEGEENRFKSKMLQQQMLVAEGKGGDNDCYDTERHRGGAALMTVEKEEVDHAITELRSGSSPWDS